ncbi:MAG: alpha/beta hydrolase [Candidatus Levybacteria bacterium]|nr:alpha/beta hydrolase [Candidatus Levybacteria bacterium]MBP9815344.1 alpha/beta hydrolase [Candidatus Levybacteria bacterium]
MGALEKKIYILHGWATDVSRWEPFLKELKNLKITPVLLPIPGLTAPLDKPWGIDDYVQWLFEIVNKEPKIALLGHSNGGRIALSFAVKYPDEINQLFLIDSAGIYHNDFISRTKRNAFRAISKVGKKITNSSLAKNLLYKLAHESDYKNATPIQQETMKRLISVDLLPVLSEIKAKTYIIWGENDQITPYTDALILKSGIQNSKLFTIPDGTHSPQFTHTSEVVNIIKENLV